MNTITLYRHALSGHAHRAQLMASLLGLNVELVDVDLANGAHKKADFLNKNLFGQVPVIEDAGQLISDSNAILLYLAQKYDPELQWYPRDLVVRSEIQRWLSVAAGQVANGPAAARLVNVFGAGLDHDNAKRIAGNLFAILDTHLQEREWLVGNRATVADIANFSYIEHAPEGDVSVTGYPNIRKWLENVKSLPGFVPMQATKVGLAV